MILKAVVAKTQSKAESKSDSMFDGHSVSDVNAAIRALRRDRHKVAAESMHGQLWFAIDDKLLASFDEMAQLGAGFYTFKELEPTLFRRWQKEHAGRD